MNGQRLAVFRPGSAADGPPTGRRRRRLRPPASMFRTPYPGGLRGQPGAAKASLRFSRSSSSRLRCARSGRSRPTSDWRQPDTTGTDLRDPRGGIARRSHACRRPWRTHPPCRMTSRLCSMSRRRPGGLALADEPGCGGSPGSTGSFSTPAGRPAPDAGIQGGTRDRGRSPPHQPDLRGMGPLESLAKASLQHTGLAANYPSPTGLALSATAAIASSFSPISGSISSSGTQSASS